VKKSAKKRVFFTIFVFPELSQFSSWNGVKKVKKVKKLQIFTFFHFFSLFFTFFPLFSWFRGQFQLENCDNLTPRFWGVKKVKKSEKKWKKVKKSEKNVKIWSKFGVKFGSKTGCQIIAIFQLKWGLKKREKSEKSAKTWKKRVLGPQNPVSGVPDTVLRQVRAQTQHGRWKPWFRTLETMVSSVRMGGLRGGPAYAQVPDAGNRFRTLETRFRLRANPEKGEKTTLILTGNRVECCKHQAKRSKWGFQRGKRSQFAF